MTRDPNDSVHQLLRELPARMPPPRLRTALRVIASKERQRLLSKRIDSRDRLKLFFTNLMRPLALPFAGSIFSAVALFSMCLMPMYPLRGDDTSDVPTSLSTEATVKSTGAIGGSVGEIVVDVMVDEAGRMVDYKIVSGANLVTTDQVRRNLENQLIFTEFTPGTHFGQPAPGKIRLSFKNIDVDVKG
jgi:hypothetical protein